MRKFSNMELLINPKICKDIGPISNLEKNLDNERTKYIIRKEFRRLSGRKKLGLLWLIFDPMATTLVYFLVLQVFRTNVNAESMIIGITMFRIFTASIKSGMNALSDFSGGIKAERIRTSVLLKAKFGYRIIDTSLQCLGVIIILILGFSTNFIGLLALFFSCQILGILSEGFGLSFSLIVKRIPDLGNLINYFLLLMFFASPVLYPMNMTTGMHYEINRFNPFSYFVEIVRECADLGSVIYDIGDNRIFIISAIIVLISIKGFSSLDKIRWEISTWS